MNSLTQLTPKQLRRAADIQEQIEELRKQLNEIQSGVEVPAPASSEEAATRGRKKKRKLSAQGLANIRAGVAKRMARKKQVSGETLKAATQSQPKKKRKMSEAWRRALERAWAARRAKGKAKS